MQLMQALELIVNGHQLIADVAAVIDPREAQQHRLNLGFAFNQHTALTGSGLVGHEGETNTLPVQPIFPRETVIDLTGLVNDYENVAVRQLQVREPSPVSRGCRAPLRSMHRHRRDGGHDRR